MATYQGYYELELKVGGRIVEMLPTDYSFIMKDSIHHVYNTLAWELHDTSGFLQEYLATIEGTKVEVAYGNPDNILSCKYVIKNDSLEQVENPGFLNGMVGGEMMNAWYDEQEVFSKAYEGRISDVVRSIAGEYNFNTTFDEEGKSTSIDGTGNESIWYQPLITNDIFIKHILLPNAYSSNSDRTPFYCFITNNNVFNWKSFKQMWQSSPLDTLSFQIDKGDNSAPNQVSDIKRWRKGSDFTKNLRRRVIVSHDYETGQILTENDNMKLYLPLGKPLPILDTSSTPTGFYDAGYNDRLTGQSENDLGQLYDSMRESMILERMLITSPFNPKLHSGGKIHFNINQLNPTSPETTKLSKYFSGEYIIEECSHVWQGSAQKGFTKCIIGRKFVDIPSTYNLKGSLIQ